MNKKLFIIFGIVLLILFATIWIGLEVTDQKDEDFDITKFDDDQKNINNDNNCKFNILEE